MLDINAQASEWRMQKRKVKRTVVATSEAEAVIWKTENAVAMPQAMFSPVDFPVERHLLCQTPERQFGKPYPMRHIRYEV